MLIYILLQTRQRENRELQYIMCTCVWFIPLHQDVTFMSFKLISYLLFDSCALFSFFYNPQKRFKETLKHIGH